MIKFKKINFLNLIILLYVFGIVFLSSNNLETMKLIGLSIIILAGIFCQRYKDNRRIALLIGIIMIISICLALSVCINPYEKAFNWQIDLVNTETNIINAKNFLLFITILTISIGNIKKEEYYLKLFYNPIIIYTLYILLFYCLIFGFDRGKVGTYSSNTNALYEYAIVIFLFAWFFSKSHKTYRKFLFFYALLYCIQGLVYGDRSSCFPMILLLFLLQYKKEYYMKQVILFGLSGILLANIIDIFRNSNLVLSLNIFREAINRGLFVNTISYSFYGGTQIINYSFAATEKLTHLLKYFLSFITGGSDVYNLSKIASINGFLNKGGGLSSNYYYFWGGYFFTIIFAIIMGRIIHKIFNSNSFLSNILKITITIFSIRWFVYYPTAFFRTALIVSVVLYYISIIFTKLLFKTFINI